MRMPSDIDAWLQKRLRMMAVEDGTCDEFISGEIASVDYNTAARWQLGTDTIYRCVKSGLIRVHNYAGYKDDPTFFAALQELSPFEDEGVILWIGVLLCGADALVSLVDKHFPPDLPYDPSPSQAFADELEAIFEHNGVPWSDRPLLPIRKS